MWSQVSNGLANGYLQRSSVDTTVGLRFQFRSIVNSARRYAIEGAESDRPLLLVQKLHGNSISMWTAVSTHSLIEEHVCES
jgi:hypothetical protein